MYMYRRNMYDCTLHMHMYTTDKLHTVYCTMYKCTCISNIIIIILFMTCTCILYTVHYINFVHYISFIVHVKLKDLSCNCLINRYC